MRKLPRRLPSNSPSLAWVGFAVLLLSIGGGLAGLYTHRQNQEASKRRLIKKLTDEVAELRERLRDTEYQISERALPGPLQMKVRDHKLALRPIELTDRILMTPVAPVPSDGGRPEPGATSPPAGPVAPSVMAVLNPP